MSLSISIPPNFVGLYFKDNQFAEQFNPGVHSRWNGLFHNSEVYYVPTTRITERVTSQEVLTKDNISLRFSFRYTFEISDPQRFLANEFVLNNFTAPQSYYSVPEASIFLQEQFREVFASEVAEEVNQKRAELIHGVLIPAVVEKMTALGVTVVDLGIIDIMFPKKVQEVLNLELEAKVRARTDLENARTTVATTRALKNAAALIDGDDAMRHVQALEVMKKVAETGNHTFVMDGLSQPQTQQ